MTTAHVFIATSLDGFIARPGGEIDFLAGPAASGEDHGYAGFMAGMDGLIMGRETYQAVLGFDPWPYDKPVMVLSRSLDPGSVPPRLRNAAEIRALSPAEALAEAAARGWRRAYVDGGALIRSFLADGLVQDIVLTRLPLLIGQGRPIFGPLPADLPLRHEGTRSFPSGLVQSRYAVGR